MPIGVRRNILIAELGSFLTLLDLNIPFNTIEYMRAFTRGHTTMITMLKSGFSSSVLEHFCNQDLLKYRA